MVTTAHTETSAKSVLLICPPITKAERYSSSIGEAGGSQPPLGVLSLAAYLREQGHHADVIDGVLTAATAEQIAQRVAQRVAEESPDLVGISATTVAVGRAIAVAEAIRSADP
ncbi:MAG: cobalamin-dependent protein, partial [Planctomycetota bacterium]